MAGVRECNPNAAHQRTAPCHSGTGFQHGQLLDRGLWPTALDDGICSDDEVIERCR